jgi:hypothetical protein
MFRMCGASFVARRICPTTVTPAARAASRACPRWERRRRRDHWYRDGRCQHRGRDEEWWHEEGPPGRYSDKERLGSLRGVHDDRLRGITRTTRAAGAARLMFACRQRMVVNGRTTTNGRPPFVAPNLIRGRETPRMRFAATILWQWQTPASIVA